MNTLTTKQLTLDAMLAALCAVLGYLSLDFVNVKITFESVPVLMAALLFGPVDAAAVGGVGTLIYQLLRYGVSATTPLWILPYILTGALVGYCAKRSGFTLSRRQMLLLIVAAELLVTLLNTGVIYLDSVIYGYYFPGIILGALALRLALCIIKAAAYAFALPPLLRPIRRALQSGKRN